MASTARSTPDCGTPQPVAVRRLVVFADPQQAAPAVLLPALLDTLAQFPSIEIAAILLARPARDFWQRWREVGRRRLQQWIGSGRFDAAAAVLGRDLLASARRRAMPIAVIPDGDPNHPSVIDVLRQRLRPDLTLNLYCMRRFGPSLLASLGQAVNYHNGALPRLRGLRASNWSLYLGDERSGFAFHRMTADFDAGRVLLRGDVAVDRNDNAADLEVRKAHAAADRLPELLEAMLDDDGGQEPTGEASYFSGADWRRLTQVAQPELLTAAEWQRRLRACSNVEARLDEGWFGVTGVAVEPRRRGRGFPSADGQWLRITSIDYWPAAFARARASPR